MKISAFIIDQEEVSTFIAKKVLEMCGVNDVVAFNNPREALEHLKKGEHLPDMIITDLFFPIMDGFYFLDEFTKLNFPGKTIRLYVASASVNPEDKEKAIEKGCTAYIEKPFTFEKAQEVIFGKISTATS